MIQLCECFINLTVAIEKTKIFGKIRYDLRVEPRNLREEEELLAKRIFDAENSKTKLQIISRNKASSIINPGATGSVSWGGNFIVRIHPSPIYIHSLS